MGKKRLSSGSDNKYSGLGLDVAEFENQGCREMLKESDLLIYTAVNVNL